MRIRHHAAFRQFKLQRFRRKTQLLKQLPDISHKVRLLKLFDREVHAHDELGKPGETVLPFADLPARFAEIPPAQFADESGFLSNRDEFRRTKKSSYGMLPSQQGFESCNLPGRQQDNRLIDVAELLTIKSVTKIGLQL